MLEFVKGCTIQLEIVVDEDITNWEIKARIYDVASNFISLATSNAGGSDDQIEKTVVGAESKFVIKVPYGTTFNWEEDGWIEIKVNTNLDVGGADEILQGYKGKVKFIKSELDWDNS